jgi:hypothetical protein
MRVSTDFFTTLGARPLLGRTFSTADGDPGRDQVVILSHTVWRQQFAADPATIGRTITLGKAACVVIGVMPPSFEYPQTGVRIWLPQPMMAEAIDRSARDHNQPPA